MALSFIMKRTALQICVRFLLKFKQKSINVRFYFTKKNEIKFKKKRIKYEVEEFKPISTFCARPK